MDHPFDNDFAIAEEVTVLGLHSKRPDIVPYVNGIALGIIELKRSIVSVGEGIRQNIRNQDREFIQPFFTTMQLIFAGNDSEGLRYGTIGTPEKYYLKWKEDEEEIQNPLDKYLTKICNKERFLEIVYDFTLFDAGIKSSAPSPVFRRKGSPRAHSETPGRHYLAYPGQR
jgi:type I restriction enzyme R subunit